MLPAWLSPPLPSWLFLELSFPALAFLFLSRLFLSRLFPSWLSLFVLFPELLSWPFPLPLFSWQLSLQLLFFLLAPAAFSFALALWLRLLHVLSFPALLFGLFHALAVAVFSSLRLIDDFSQLVFSSTRLFFSPY